MQSHSFTRRALFKLGTAGAGKYELRCRTIDANGAAQPLPRPFPKSGKNTIQKMLLEVVA